MRIIELESLGHGHGLLPKKPHKFVEINLAVLVDVHLVYEPAHFITEGEIARMDQILQVRLAQLVVLVDVHSSEGLPQKLFILVDKAVQERSQKL